MSLTKRLITLLAVTLLASGCASGLKHSEVAAKMQPVKEGEGRVYFYRSASMFGAAVQPDIRLSGTMVGTSKPGGYFFVDRPAGTYTAAASTEVERSLSLSLASQETKYVRTSPSFGVLVGRIEFELIDAKTAEAELRDLSYTGTLVK